jgi:hypothetical protein
MKKLILALIVPLLFGVFLMGCEPIEEGEMPPADEQMEQEM